MNTKEIKEKLEDSVLKNLGKIVDVVVNLGSEFSEPLQMMVGGIVKDKSWRDYIFVHSVKKNLDGNIFVQGLTGKHHSLTGYSEPKHSEEKPTFQLYDSNSTQIYIEQRFTLDNLTPLLQSCGLYKEVLKLWESREQTTRKDN